ncbi:GGDEF domain-containing protein [Actinoplanes couchii]|uniref:GGDEF domain-containing protein n=1 Tax=Actinoplanes couchii TaxID=403638 RepID=A0ABQ3X8R1_9ACTN|nr:GGDEF domain-containing protein [Actinoplanes couchii]MDR6320098.1 diguanylate cyclase (GGDEF)-like protein [Actinoplanes couchii]GID54887.1 hypothetical protein Aco03nite_032910 [Actinoplanes couchii]
MRDVLTTSRLVVLGLLAAGLYLAAGLDLLPAWASLIATAVAAVAVTTATVAGLRRHRPSHRAPWLCVLAGSLINLIGISLAVLQRVTGQDMPVDAVYLAEYPLIAAVAVLWTRIRGGQDPTGWIDVAVIVVGLATLSWPVLLVPALDAPGATIMPAVYLCMDLLILGTALRMLLGGGRNGPALGLLGGALGCFLAGDAMNLTGHARLAIVAESLWVLMPLLVGAAAVHPSMAALHRRDRSRPIQQSGRWLLVLSLPLLVGPAALILGHAGGDNRYVAVYAGASAILSALVMGRMWLMLQQQRTLAVTDGLTGLRTRRYFEEALATAVARQERAVDPFGVLILDVDHFKRVNDTRGHNGGDRVLQELADRLRTATRAGDVVARYGGEEFVLLLAHAGPDATLTIAERIRAAVAAQPIPMGDGPPQPITVSVGAAWMPGPADTSAQLMLQADHCLYAAKDQGRNRVMAGTTPGGCEANPGVTP